MKNKSFSMLILLGLALFTAGPASATDEKPIGEMQWRDLNHQHNKRWAFAMTGARVLRMRVLDSVSVRAPSLDRNRVSEFQKPAIQGHRCRLESSTDTRLLQIDSGFKMSLVRAQPDVEATVVREDDHGRTWVEQSRYKDENPLFKFYGIKNYKYQFFQIQCTGNVTLNEIVDDLRAANHGVPLVEFFFNSLPKIGPIGF